MKVDDDEKATTDQNSMSIEDKEKLKEEAKQFYILAKNYRSERYMKEEKFAYILDKQFLTRWKEYVNYYDVKKHQQFSLYSHHFGKRKSGENKIYPHPGKIENERLLVPLEEFYNDGNPDNPDNIVIRNDIDQKTDYRLVNEEIWNFFHQRYGGGPKIIRYSIEEKTKYNYSKKIIEVFYRKYSIIYLKKRREITEDYINNLEVKPIYISRIKTLPDLKEKIATILPRYYNNYQIDKDKIRLWKIECKLEELRNFLSEKREEIMNSNKKFDIPELNYLEYLPKCSLEELDFFDTDLCLMEEMDDDWLIELKAIELKNGSCEWCRGNKLLRYPCVCKDVWYCTEICKERDLRFHEDRCKKRFEIEESNLKKSEYSRLGLVGLQNLGNTCFMNTALQCISNCYELTNFFLEGHYKSQLNIDNPIGSQGVLAKSYAHLLTNLWYGTTQVFSPSKFKRAIECFQSMFTGYQQHDTHEFLNYLLDGLHEDLNKVLKKPLVEKVESNEPDEIKSEKSWIGFLRRNQSILVELLYGQYKSTLFCPDENCGNISTCFDPFLSVSLPLASRTRTYTINCFFIFYNTNQKAVKLEIPFNTECTIMALRNKIASILNIHPFSFIIGKLESTSKYDNFISSSSLLRGTNIYANEPRRMFLIQLNPALFYSDCNKFYLQDKRYTLRNYEKISEEVKNNPEIEKIFTEEHEENDHGQTSEGIVYYSGFSFRDKSNTFKINNDNNYGFDNHLHSVVYLTRYEEHKNDVSSRIKVIFPRIFTISKDWTTKEVHFQIFKFIHPVLLKYEEKNNSKNYPELVKKSENELFEHYFGKLRDSTSTEKDSIEYQKKLGFPYRIRVKNYNGPYDPCYYCDKKGCDDCLLPFSEQITIRDLIEKIPKNDDLEIDNSYLFLKENQRFYALKNRDISFELTFFEYYHESIKSLNEFEDLSFNLKKSITPKSISINDCFRNFVKPEVLKEDNEWYCNLCKKHVKAKKKMEIYKTPNILIIQLKRFSASNKIDTLVDFPIENLDLSQVVINKNDKENLLYDLFAISNHYGGLGGGHYTAYAQNYLNKDWYEFNDSSVHRVSKDNLVSSSAYVLFYRRKNLNHLVNLPEIYLKPFVNYENTYQDSKKDEMALD